MRASWKAALWLAPALASAFIFPHDEGDSAVSGWGRCGGTCGGKYPVDRQKNETTAVVDFKLGCPGCFGGPSDDEGLFFDVQIYESERACGFANLTVNGQDLAQEWDGVGAHGSGVITTRPRFGAHNITAQWQMSCLFNVVPEDGSNSNGEDVIQVLTFAIQQVDGQDVPTPPGFTLSFKQMLVPELHRLLLESVPALGGIESWQDPGLLPQVPEPVPEQSAEELVEEIKQLKMALRELKRRLKQKKMLLRSQVKQEAKDLKNEIKQCDSIRCIAKAIVRKAHGAVKLIYIKIKSRPVHYENQMMRMPEGEEQPEAENSWKSFLDWNKWKFPRPGPKKPCHGPHGPPGHHRRPPPPEGDYPPPPPHHGHPPPPPPHGDHPPPPPPDGDRPPPPPPNDDHPPPPPEDGHPPPPPPPDDDYPPPPPPPEGPGHHHPPGPPPDHPPPPPGHGPPRGRLPTHHKFHPKYRESPREHLIHKIGKGLQLFAAALGVVCVAVFLHKHCKNSRRCADRRAAREERRSARQYRRAARRQSWLNWWHGRQQPSDYEEKRALILSQEGVLESAMQAEIRELQNAHEVVSSLVQAEEGRAPRGFGFARADSLPDYRSDAGSVTTEPPAYDLNDGSDDSAVVADGFQYTPSASDWTPGSSVVGTSRRESEDSDHRDAKE